MKTKKSKLIEISELKDFTPEPSEIYLFKGARVPCPDCDSCVISKIGVECKFKTNV